MKCKILMIIGLLLFLAIPSIAQTTDEWFKQKKTQRKYLLLQIAKLQVHIERVRKGYQIVKDGLNLVGQIKDGDFKIHHLFMTDLDKIKSVIRQSPRFINTYKLYQENKQHCIQLFHDMPGYEYLSPYFIAIIQKYLQSVLKGMDNEMQSILEISLDGEVQMSDDERFERIDKVYLSLLYTKQTLLADHNKIALYNHQRSKTILGNQQLLEQY